MAPDPDEPQPTQRPRARPQPADPAPVDLGKRDGPPQYTKYRTGPSLLRGGGEGRLGLGPKTDESGRRVPRGPRRRPRLGFLQRPVGRITPGRVVKYLAGAAVAWILLSAVVFLISAWVHQEDVPGGVLGGKFPLTSASTVLVLGSDARPKGSKEPGAGSGPSRADSILLMRAGPARAARLSIPRDTVVDIPGHGQNKINAAYAFGGSKLMVQTIKANFGLSVDHVVEVNFSNFPDLIDALGGVDYEGGCVISFINGGFKNGGYTLRLKNGKSHIDGKQALALARTRKNECNKKESDLTRARRQQKLFSSMKSRLISPGAFVRLPFISWAAPKSLRSDMSGPTLLGLFAVIATTGTPPTQVLKPTGAVTLPDGGQGLEVSPARRQAAARKFLKG